MSLKRGELTRRILIGINILFAFFYLLVCLVPFLDAGKFWFIAILGLVFPFLLIIIFLFLVIWLLKRSRWALLSAIVLLLSWQQLSVIIPFRFKKEFVPEKNEGTIRVLSWNVNRLDEANKKARGGTSFRNLMLDVIQMQDADIICMQEFFECYYPPDFEPNIPAFEKMGYPYHYFFPSTKMYDKYHFGEVIFSRFPILDSAKFITTDHPHSEGHCSIDIMVKGERVRIFTTHLESVGFNKEDYKGLGEVDKTKGLLSKIKNSYRLRTLQANVLGSDIATSPYPAIVCGDIDDVPNSYAYFKVRGKLQDVFLKKGYGLGGTLSHLSPTLRIDYILADKQFKVEQYTRLNVPYSDHYALIADLNLKVKQ